MPQAKSISSEPVQLVAESDPRGDYELQVELADIRVSDRRQDASEGRLLRAGRPAILTVDRDTEAIYGVADEPNATASVEIEKTRFSVVRLPPMTLSGTRRNRGDITAKSHDPSSDGNQLPDIEVPDGFAVTVRADGGDLGIGPAGSGSAPFTIPENSSVSLGVSNADAVRVEERSAGATAEVVVET